MHTIGTVTWISLGNGYDNYHGIYDMTRFNYHDNYGIYDTEVRLSKETKGTYPCMYRR